MRPTWLCFLSHLGSTSSVLHLFSPARHTSEDIGLSSPLSDILNIWQRTPFPFQTPLLVRSIFREAFPAAYLHPQLYNQRLLMASLFFIDVVQDYLASRVARIVLVSAVALPIASRTVISNRLVERPWSVHTVSDQDAIQEFIYVSWRRIDGLRRLKRRST